MNLTALYRFKLLPANPALHFSLQPIGKTGNNKVFNDLFTSSKLIKVKDIGPIMEICDGYQAKTLNFTDDHGSVQTIVFEGKVKLLDYHGIVKVNDYKRDCYLYTLIEPDIFEVYISEGNGRLTQHLLMMLCDGYLEKEIEVLRSRTFA